MVKRIVAVLVIIGLLVGAYFSWQFYRAQQSAQALRNFQTMTISRGSLTATVGATGIVRPNQTALLLWQTSGTVDKVSPKVGDTVAVGVKIASLRSDSVAQNIILAQIDLTNSQKSLDELQKSGVAPAKTLVVLQTAQKAVIEAKRALDQYSAQDYKDKLDKARENEAKVKDELKTAQDNFDPYKDWDPDNQTYKDFKTKMDDAQRNYDEAVRVRELLELEKQAAQSNLDLANAQLTDAQREYDRIKNGPDPNDVAALQARITAAKSTLALADITTPFAGTITDIESQVGDQVVPGKYAFRLDDLSRLLVDVKISEVDIDRIQVGQAASLVFDAIQGKEYHGEVKEVSKVGANTTGVVEFLVTVELADEDESVRTAMTAAVNIVVDQRENVLLLPNRAVRVQDGQRVVYIVKDGQLQAVQITLGASSDTMSEVVDGGLRLGDSIVLNPPNVFDTSGPPPFVRR